MESKNIIMFIMNLVALMKIGTIVETDVYVS